MTPLVGVFALALGWCGATATAVTALVDAWRGRDSAVPRWCAAVALAGALLAVVAAEWALLAHDFGVAFVAANGSRETPLYYTVTSLWAAHDGSLLLWNLLLTGAVLVLARRAVPGAPHLRAWAVAAAASVASFFLGLAVLAGHVFDRVGPVPADGPGPTPLLATHPAMGVHPPLLYLGLVSLVVPFGYGVAALVTGDAGPAWVRAVQGPLRVAWTALTAGIVLGSWWSYAVLGWGGYWAWDPVENSSLMPWLLATALVHSLLVQRRSGALAGWSCALAVLTFLLAAVGVVLTRSGVVASVHSFADSGVGPALLAFVLALAGGLVVLLLARRASGVDSGAPPTVASRGGALLLDNVVLATLTVTVLLGTLLPVAVEALGGGRLSVGPPYYERMVVPLGLALLALMAIGPRLPWAAVRGAALARLAVVPAVVAGSVVLLVRLAGAPGAAALACALAAATAVTAVLPGRRSRRRTSSSAPTTAGLRARGRSWWRRRAALGGRVAHVGLAVLVVGIAVSSSGARVGERTLTRGETVTIAGRQVELVSVDRGRDGTRMRTAAVVTVDGVAMSPGLDFHPARETTVARPAVDSGPLRDVYLTLLSVRQDGGGARVRLAVNPFVSWIWAGGTVVVLGGLLGVGARRGRRDDHGAASLPARDRAPAGAP